jgi:VWFA-related protein
MLGLAAIPAQQTAPEFKAETKLVLVPVVVRDAKGEVVSNLTKEDFRLFDNGKEQAIASFAVEETSGRVAEDRGQPDAQAAAGAADSAPMVVPERYVALVFDDQHFKLPGKFGEAPAGFIGDASDLWYVRDSARKMLKTLKAADRVAVITSSGRVALDFTDDRSQVEAALMKLRPGDPVMAGDDINTLTQSQTVEMLRTCTLVVGRMAHLPGQRTLVFLSPGLLLQTPIGWSPPWSEIPAAMKLIDDAIRSRVVINSLDARGLSPTPLSIAGWFLEFQQRVTDGTGGTYIRDTNDLDGAVERLATTPKYIYVLGFSPQGVRPDGSFHRLTVKLREGRNLDVQARFGYVAPGGSELTANSGKHSVTTKAEAPQYSETESKELAKALDIRPPAPAAPAVELPKPAPAAKDEITTVDRPLTFKVQTNLVEVPVIVRDRDGRAVGNLKQEDFRIFDKGKRQEIAKFAVVVAGASNAPTAQTKTASPAAPANASKPQAALPAAPTRFVAFVFDDLHMLTDDVQQVRAAVQKYVSTSLKPGDRVALATTTGQFGVDFTDDSAAVIGPMNKIMPSPLAEKSLSGCGAYVSYFQAVQVDREVGLHPQPEDIKKSLALAVAVAQYGDFHVAVKAINDAYTSGLQESRNTLAALRAVVRRMASMPGERSVVLVSPGFFVPFDLQQESDELMSQAIHAKLLINIVDARGVWTNLAYSACKGGADAATLRGETQLRDAEGHANTNELIAIAEDTGGASNFNNDFFGGIEKAAAAPEYRYILGFAPQDLKLDGSFHALKVTVASGEKLTLQARRGYWAPKHPEDEASVSKQDIEDAVFSRDQTHGLAAEMHTRLTKAGDQARLSVLTSLDLKSIHLRKADGRNRNDVTIVAALFDTNGNFLEGTEKVVELRLLDRTVTGLPEKPPVVISTDFDVKPGAYLVRLVVRDAEERQVTAENASVRVQ